MSSDKPRILVVEDDAQMRSLLKITLEREGYEVDAEPDGRAIQEVSVRFRPTLAILDVRLPVGPDGYQLARELRTGSDLPILFLTVADSLEARLAGFRAGADDYLGKPFSMEELVARVEALLRRSRRNPAPMRKVGDVVVDEVAHKVERSGETLDLTPTEYRLLHMLVEHADQVLTKDQLLSAVWGFDAYDANLVEVHMSSLRRKLEDKGKRLVHTVRGVGYVFRS